MDEQVRLHSNANNKMQTKTLCTPCSINYHSGHQVCTCDFVVQEAKNQITTFLTTTATLKQKVEILLNKCDKAFESLKQVYLPSFAIC